MTTMNISIKRTSPVNGASKMLKVVIDDSILSDMTVQNLLEYITCNVDPSLAYYCHSVCEHGVCKRCILKVNSKTVLACTTRVSSYSHLNIEPADVGDVVRDLVVCFKK